MKWSRQQEQAIDAVGAWLKSDQQVFRLFGAAGTGKSSLALHLSSQVEGKVLFGAFTGRAAHVLKTKGCEEATTIHKLIYISRAKSQENARNMVIQLKKLQTEFHVADDKLEWHPKTRPIWLNLQNEKKKANQPFFVKNDDSPVKGASLLVLDEVSMVPDSMKKDLESFGTKLLVLGDPYQLPPVFGAGAFTECKPDFLLTEIHRQARDNPIIDMATRVRNGERLLLGNYGTSKVVSKADPSDVMEANQIICGRNATRVAINKKVRKLRNFVTEFPERGDRLMCLRNNHQAGLLNGSIWKCLEAGPVDDGELNVTIESEDDGTTQSAQVLASSFNNPKPNEAPWEADGAESFEYGYAATCHKLQGSEFPKVVVFDQSSCFPQPSRWTYTAITRASDEVTLVRE